MCIEGSVDHVAGFALFHLRVDVHPNSAPPIIQQDKRCSALDSEVSAAFVDSLYKRNPFSWFWDDSKRAIGHYFAQFVVNKQVSF